MDMNTVSEFYKKRTILESFKKWRSPFVYYVTDDNKDSILFQSEILQLLTKKEERYLSRKIISLLDCEDFCTENFINMLTRELGELKDAIRMDFDL